MVLTLAVLASLALTAHGQPAGEKPDKECCDTKTVGGVTYSLIGQMDTKMYNCLSDCIYMKEGQEGSKFCFAMGDLQVECNDEEMEGSEKPPMEGSEKPPMEGSEKPPMEGSEKPPMEGSEKPPMEEGSSPAPGGSTDAYCALSSDHTLCKYQGASASCAEKTIFRSLSAAGKAAILDRHNDLRRKVAKGEEVGGINPPQPAAANMRKMVWNEELELIAQRWADQCTFGHDSVRTKLDGTQVGQNAFIGYSSAQAEEGVVQAGMAQPAQSWYDEVTNPGFDSQNINPFKFSSGTGHYTQLVWADSEELGCAVVYYKDTSAPLDYNNLVVCNYAKAGNFLNSVMYQTGAACSACPAGYGCEDGLCAKTVTRN